MPAKKRTIGRAVAGLLTSGPIPRPTRRTPKPLPGVSGRETDYRQG